MTYLGYAAPYYGAGAATAALRPLASQPVLELGSTTVTVVADPRLTGGRYSLYRLDLAASAGGADPHFHRRFAESFHVLGGTLELFDGRSWVATAAGDHLFVPSGGVHGFRNLGPEPAALLMMSTPGVPREDYFAELAELTASGRSLTAAEWTRLYARHDQYMV